MPAGPVGTAIFAAKLLRRRAKPAIRPAAVECRYG